MTHDTGLAQILRDALQGDPVIEKRMMGGLTFMVHGHMLCGVHTGGAMVRVGKPNHAAALAIPGVGPMTFTGRAGRCVRCGLRRRRPPWPASGNGPGLHPDPSREMRLSDDH